MESRIMRKFGPAGILMALCLIAVLTGCGKNGSNDSANAFATNDLAAAENAGADLEQDSALEAADREDRQAAADLFIEDSDVCVQFMRLHAPEEWAENVSYHYFQDRPMKKALFCMLFWNTRQGRSIQREQGKLTAG